MSSSPISSVFFPLWDSASLALGVSLCFFSCHMDLVLYLLLYLPRFDTGSRRPCACFVFFCLFFIQFHSSLLVPLFITQMFIISALPFQCYNFLPFLWSASPCPFAGGWHGKRLRAVIFSSPSSDVAKWVAKVVPACVLEGDLKAGKQAQKLR